MTGSYLQMDPMGDIFSDACLRDGAGNLLFYSLFARDTSTQQMFSAFSMPVSQGGLDSFHLQGPDGQRHLIGLGDSDRLGKLTGRLPKDNLFGNLVHTWVFDRSLQQPDYANRVAWLVDQVSNLSGTQLQDRIWGIYKLLSPVPLLDSWKATLLDATRSAFVTDLAGSPFPPLGDIAGYRVQLGDDFLDMVSSMVKSRRLTLKDQRDLDLAA